VSLRLPPAELVPPGFVYIPPGRYLAGSAAAEALRHYFFESAPAYPADTDGYLIARTETTYADWLAYLDAWPPTERDVRRPSAGESEGGGRMSLARGASGWELTMYPNEHGMTLRGGDQFVYPERPRLAAQDWRRMPVVGISIVDARAYAAWLDRSGRLRGAHVCRDWEWERAGHGADGRQYPHGDVLLADDANFDLTYGRLVKNYGPDEVSSHPSSRSPFDVDDLAGNVFEFVVNSDDTLSARGGCWYKDQLSAAIANRGDRITDENFRNHLLGFRVCASAPTW
jgi:formylglycine-generating enzyme required for sulfatase activity